MVGLPDIELQRAVVRAFEDSGVRGVLGRATRELHHDASHRDPWYHPLDEALAQISQLASEYDNGLPKPERRFPPRANPRTMTTKGLERIVEFVTDSGSQATIHLAEYDAERTEGYETLGNGGRSRSWPRSDCSAPTSLLLTRCLVDDAELDILAETKTQVSYNPVSNCYIGAGNRADHPDAGNSVSMSASRSDGSSVKHSETCSNR